MFPIYFLSIFSKQFKFISDSIKAIITTYKIHTLEERGETVYNIVIIIAQNIFSKFDIDLEYLDNTLYLSVFDVKLKSTISSIKEIETFSKNIYC